MGFFDFLKGKTTAPQPLVHPNVDRPACDITKTQTILDLFLVPKSDRDEKWAAEFYENVKTATFACGNPQTITGPDGFPYFVLQTPEAYKPFDSFCLQNMKDDFLLEKGLGVVVNPGESSADWVFSYGDILNLHINKELYTRTDNSLIENEVTIRKDEQVLIAQPSETYLPQKAKQVLKLFLQSIGIKQPKILMMCRTIEKQVIQELAFNIFREDFQSTEELNLLLKKISWFLPMHYIVLSLPKNSNFDSSFADL
ncbi:MAG: hypothetical protein EOP45_01445 [Sphingobacteriaceae bacterium]|nr:MAG: hypothetical protein EOP45_01445 [Sphingobacteriaceae bacterium]